MCSSLLQKSIKGGLAVTGGLNLGGSLETIFNPIAVVEAAIEKGAASILMPISSRRQLNDLPDDLAAKITIHYYLDARDALLKALTGKARERLEPIAKDLETTAAKYLREQEKLGMA